MTIAIRLNRRATLIAIVGGLCYAAAGLAKAEGGGNSGNGGNAGGNGNSNAGGNGNGNPSGGNSNANGNGKADGDGNAVGGKGVGNAAPGSKRNASKSKAVTTPGGVAAGSAEHDLVLKAVEEGRVLPLRKLMAQIESKFGAEVIDAELRSGGDRLVYKLKMLSDQGRIFIVSVDAATGLP